MRPKTKVMDTRDCKRPGCGHEYAGHQHYRDGLDCSQCECEQFVGSRVLAALIVLRSNSSEASSGARIGVLRRIARPSQLTQRATRFLGGWAALGARGDDERAQ